VTAILPFKIVKGSDIDPIIVYSCTCDSEAPLSFEWIKMSTNPQGRISRRNTGANWQVVELTGQIAKEINGIHESYIMEDQKLN
jgi:hypothetical protein